ncbi:hypothetical protein I8752_24315 [Nostocaceae cyanobacterium CENA369]|uniref:O-methyltransferase C-terminal domain-containing protein n=2 Tax=Dendronalium TaxID=2840442 RepID=A0A8J7I8A2_9NOST|nr:hypothetical protein [Dendronalium phyllosphericum CENA369]
MRWIIHDWNDEKSSLILKNCHQAMPDCGKLLLVESIFDALYLLTRLVLCELPANARILCVGVGTGTELGYP